jgi:glycosyltransferase involved in cell wall biosynthesis
MGAAITVVTVNKNNARGLAKTLASVAKQAYRPVEHIVIDGLSSDNSSQIIATFPHIKKWVSEPDSGVYHAQNKGLSMATGAYSIFLNSGDYFWDENTLALLWEAAERHTIVYGNKYVEQENGSLVLKAYPGDVTGSFFEYDTLPHCCTLIPTRLLRARGGYDASLRICADWQFFRSVWRAGLARFVHVPGACSVFEYGGLSALPQSRHEILMERKRIKAAEKTLPARIKRKADSLLAKYGLWIPQS